MLENSLYIITIETFIYFFDSKLIWSELKSITLDQIEMSNRTMAAIDANCYERDNNGLLIREVEIGNTFPSMMLTVLK